MGKTIPKVPFFKDSGCCPKIVDYTLTSYSSVKKDNGLQILRKNLKYVQKMCIFVPVINESTIDQVPLFNAFHKYPFLDETGSYMILINIYFFHNQNLNFSFQKLQWSSFLIVSLLIIRLISGNDLPQFIS